MTDQRNKIHSTFPLSTNNKEKYTDFFSPSFPLLFCFLPSSLPPSLFFLSFYVCMCIYVSFFETRSHCVVLTAIPELPLQIRLTSSSQRWACLCSLNDAGIKGMCHHDWSLIFILRVSVLCSKISGHLKS